MNLHPLRSLALGLALVPLAACDPDGAAPPPVPAPDAPRQPVASTGAATPAPAPPETVSAPAPAAPPPAASRAWLDPRGTSIVGFGILRLVPRPGEPATWRIAYREVPDGYASTGNLQLFVLPGDAFARSDRAYAGDFLAFARTADEAETAEDGSLRLAVTVTADTERTVLVAYGPWTAPDAGRPAGDVPTFRLDVTSPTGAFEWVESEAGEMITTNWTGRPEVERGTAARDPLDGTDVWIEVRPMILYDGRLVRSADEPLAADGTPDVPGGPTPAALRAEAADLEREGRAALAADRRERAADIEAQGARADRRLTLTPQLAEKFRRVPIRWR